MNPTDIFKSTIKKQENRPLAQNGKKVSYFGPRNRKKI